MIRIAICDDDKRCLEQISIIVEDEFKQLDVVCDIHKYDNGQELLNSLESIQFDLILLDIQMPGVSGFSVAQQIHNMTKGDNLMFVSNEEQMVYQTFSFRPMGFVRKRELDTELRAELGKWYNAYGVDKGACITVQHEKEDVIIHINDIVYIESKAHYVHIFTKERVYRIRAKLADYNSLLQKREFVKCNTSQICNLRYVCKMDGRYFILIGDVVISISRKDKESITNKYNEYIKFRYM